MAIPQVNHTEHESFIDLSFRTFKPLLTIGKPGIGKTYAKKAYSKKHGVELMVSHPAVDDPTDWKGFPARATRKVKADYDEFQEAMGVLPDIVVEEIATFLPFGQLLRAIEATEPIIWDLDDFGQAPMSVQAAVMQPLGAREINGLKISEHVRFMASTNRRGDKAGVKGLLTPVNRRFLMKVELVATLDDFRDYSYLKGLNPAITDYMNYTLGALNDFNPNIGMEGYANPASWEDLDLLIKENVIDDNSFLEKLCCSCIGEKHGRSFAAFLRIKSRMRSYNEVIADWEDCDLNEPMDVRFATIGMLANVGKVEHAAEIMGYICRMGKEYQTVFIKTLVACKSPLLQSSPVQRWTAANIDIFTR